MSYVNQCVVPLVSARRHCCAYCNATTASSKPLQLAANPSLNAAAWILVVHSLAIKKFLACLCLFHSVHCVPISVAKLDAVNRLENLLAHINRKFKFPHSTLLSRIRYVLFFILKLKFICTIYYVTSSI